MQLHLHCLFLQCLHLSVCTYSVYKHVVPTSQIDIRHKIPLTSSSQTMIAHKLPWNFDLRGSLYTHTASGVHLGTERLIGTQYQWIALWARYSLCAIARDPTQNPYIIETLKRLGILSWSRMRVKLEDQLYFDYPHFPDFKVYWEELTVQSGGVLYDCGP
jgi:hypothetical protein